MYFHHNYKTIFATTLVSLILLSGCSSSSWDDATQADTYEAYQQYINDHPEGDHMQEARMRADSSYWNNIKKDTAAAAFNTYLKEFPKGRFRQQAQVRADQTGAISTRGRVTGSNIIIRSDHTTESSSAGVIAKKGTVVQILDRYRAGSSDEAILNQSVTITSHGRTITLPKGKAIRILSDRNDSVKASFITNDFGSTVSMVSKKSVETMAKEKWYKIHTKDDITGWIYGKYLKEL